MQLNGLRIVFALIFLGLISFTLLPNIYQTRVCVPPGVSRQDAREIRSAAAQIGNEFRSKLGAARAQGQSLKDNEYLEALLSDPEAALARAKYLYYRQGASHLVVRALLDQGEDLDDILSNSRLYLTGSENNYITELLDQHLRKLALSVGGSITEDNYRFIVEPNQFVLALAQFSRSAGLVYLNGHSFPSEHSTAGRERIVFQLRETWPLFRDDGILSIHIVIQALPTSGEILVSTVRVSGYDYITNASITAAVGNTDCFTAFSEVK